MRDFNSVMKLAFVMSLAVFSMQAELAEKNVLSLNNEKMLSLKILTVKLD